MTVKGSVDDRQLAEAFQFCVDWQLEPEAGAVVATRRPAASRPPGTVLSSSEPIPPSVEGSANLRRRTGRRPC
jgi:hypothetical protein